jgi:hypothetical protein
MTMKRISKQPAILVGPTTLWALADGRLYEQPDPLDIWELSRLDGMNAERERAFWDDHKAKILVDWIRTRPGTRPDRFWRFDAPEPHRQRIGGIGDPAFEHLAYVPSYKNGIPDIWITEFDTRYYNGQAVTVNGDPIECQWKPGEVAGKAIDPANPPTFESEAAFLRCHNLLEPGEEKRLRPADYEPEIILPESEGTGRIH